MSSVCTGNEKEIVTLFLNIIRAKNFYETYGNLLNPDTLFPQDSPFSQPGEAPPQRNGTADSQAPAPSSVPFSGDFSSMLNKDQQETLRLLKSLFSNE